VVQLKKLFLAEGVLGAVLEEQLGRGGEASLLQRTEVEGHVHLRVIKIIAAGSVVIDAGGSFRDDGHCGVIFAPEQGGAPGGDVVLEVWREAPDNTAVGYRLLEPPGAAQGDLLEGFGGNGASDGILDPFAPQLANGHELLLDRTVNLQLGRNILWSATEDGYFHQPVAQQLHRAASGVLMNMEDYVAVFVGEIQEQLGDVAIRHGSTNPHSKWAFGATDALANILAEIVLHNHKGRNKVVQKPSSIGEGYIPGASLEESGTVMSLQAFQLVAQGGLGDKKLPGSSGNTPCLYYLYEVVIVLCIHIISSLHFINADKIIITIRENRCQVAAS